MIDQTPPSPSSNGDALTLTLPDGSTRHVSRGTLPADVVRSIGERLLQAAVAVEVDGHIQDLVTPLRAGGDVPRAHRHATRSSLERASSFGGAHARHGGATPAPGREDRLRPGHRRRASTTTSRSPQPFTPEDLDGVRERDAEGHGREVSVRARRGESRARRSSRFVDDPLKLERLSELGDDEIISTYTDGPFIDLCRGPHVPDTSRSSTSSCTHTAGAYWRGDSKRQMLQRIYGTAFFKKEELDAHLARIEEAKKRDHRVLGKQLDLFMMHPFSPGAVFWTERGTATVQRDQRLHSRAAARRLPGDPTPLLYNKGLWEISGHWGKYRENMFLVLDNETGEHDFSLKPMNCPSHYLLYLSEEALVPRAAAALRHVRRAASQRGDRRALGPHARAAVPAGRLPHLPHAKRRSRTKSQFLLRLHPRVLRDVRPERDAEVRDASRGAHRQRRDVGSRRVGAARRARGDGHVVRAEGGRRRVLRPEDRLRRH